MKNLIYILAIAVVVASCNMADKTASTKATAEKERMQQFYDKVINAHNADMVDSFCTADFGEHNADQGHTGKGIDDMKATFKDFFAAFPDFGMTSDLMIGEGDMVMTHVTMRGTNRVEMGKMPAIKK